MSEQILDVLNERPQDIFKLFKTGQETENEFNRLTKSFLDPYTKKYSILDEIYIDGLDSSQVYGQSKMVFDGVGEYLLGTAIPEAKEKYQLDKNAHDESDEDDNDELDEESEQGEESEEGEEGEENQSEEGEEDQNEEVEEDQSEEVEEYQSEEDEEDDIERTTKSDFASFSDDEQTLKSDPEDSDTETHVEEKISPVKDAFGLNDEFFDIDEYNKQILALEDENIENNDDDEEIDFFADLSDGDSDEEEMTYYDEFFDQPGAHLRQLKDNLNKSTKKSNKSEKEDNDEDGDDFDLDEQDYTKAVDNAMLDLFAGDEDEVKKQAEDENLSTFEKTQLKLQREIEKLESELVAEKKWTMKGEISSKDRPQDSLLDDPDSNNLEFERTAKPVPTITDEVTETIEDLIRRRIKNNEFDDLPKRFITDIAKFHNKQKYELSEQKSTKSLAEIYEDQYNQVDDQKEIDEELKKKHDEISDLFTKVTHKLDALCSAHFIPKPHQFKTIEIKVNDNAASINMEDAQPLHVLSESTLAPQEVYKIGDDKPKANGVLGRSEVQLKSGLSYSKDELSRDDKQRLRRANKRKKSKEFNHRQSLQKQRQLHQEKTQPSNPNKRQKVGAVIDTLSKAKNVTVIDRKGQLRDTKGNVKKDNGPKGSSNLKL